jgi:5-methylcytosine-specific restriction endonuclease McrA
MAKYHSLARGKRQRILAIVATDSTFERAELRGQAVWIGKCLHCNSKLTVAADGEPISQATIEHIVPRTHGGTDALENLGLACARCNMQKGYRHDVQDARDARAREVVAKLLERRRSRWREAAP